MDEGTQIAELNKRLALACAAADTHPVHIVKTADLWAERWPPPDWVVTTNRGLDVDMRLPGLKARVVTWVYAHLGNNKPIYAQADNVEDLEAFAQRVESDALTALAPPGEYAVAGPPGWKMPKEKREELLRKGMVRGTLTEAEAGVARAHAAARREEYDRQREQRRKGIVPGLPGGPKLQ